ncbi:MAG: hypothetical protein WBD40_20840, partial [Tepidisphaeraceae bacterium]
MSVVEAKSVASGSSALSSSESGDERPPVSAKQLRANRRNAKRSTGPRTDEGKARSSKNATTHGTFAADLLLPGEDENELVELRRGIYVSLSPQDVLERELVDRVVAAQWRLRRLRGSERTTLLVDDRDPSRLTPAQRQLDLGLRTAYKAGLFQLFESRGGDPRAAEKQIDEIVANDFDERPSQPAPAVALARSFCHTGSGIVERLSRYQQRIEQSVHRALRELRQLRKDRREIGQTPACPYLAELEADREGDALAREGSGVRPTTRLSSSKSEAGNSAQRRGADEGSDDNAWARAEMCRNVPSAPIVQNEPISVATSAALDAAEGC